ncbi:Hypothetical protein [Lactobacillus plantarum ZJ316] [Lactiplantibacillus mudanjiangensis]|uniref:hypothetical protein n=1 Tax=Lactiplantibacillus mudanjiangensis TaxID=1296538 RepID=UPI001014C9EF|nr:Hypothetical protein [Lactobacillus plantarum ZJ316] [Lactiplantibacillus mudanjiangensis]
MTDLEKIEDMYPELKFYYIEVNNPHYHGHIDGDSVYINSLQDDVDWLLTALHETSHYENDRGDYSNQQCLATMHAEHWAVMEANKRYKVIFG